MASVMDERGGVDRREGAEELKRLYVDRRKFKPTPKEKFLASLKWSVQTFVLPAALAGASIYVSINLEESQIKHSAEMTRAELASTDLIEQKKLQIARIQQLNTIHNAILIDLDGLLAGEKISEISTIQKIKSMIIYKETALPFLESVKGYANRIDEISPSTFEKAGKFKTISIETDAAILRSIGAIQLDMSGTHFEEETNLRYAILSNSKLNGSKFARVKLFSANFTNSDLTKVDFTGADLGNVSFRNSSLKDAIFDQANVTGADFTGARIRDIDFTGTKGIASAVIPSKLIAGPIFSSADFTKILERDFESVLALEDADKIVCYLWQRYHPQMEGKNMNSEIQQNNFATVDRIFIQAGHYENGIENNKGELRCNLVRKVGLWSSITRW